MRALQVFMAEAILAYRAPVTRELDRSHVLAGLVDSHFFFPAALCQ